jgi:hypothetical protein
MEDNIIYSNIQSKTPTPLSCSPGIDWSLYEAKSDGRVLGERYQQSFIDRGEGLLDCGLTDVSEETSANIFKYIDISCVDGYYKAYIIYRYGAIPTLGAQFGWYADIVSDENGNPSLSNIEEYNKIIGTAFTYFPPGTPISCEGASELGWYDIGPNCSNCEDFLALVGSPSPTITFSLI